MNSAFGSGFILGALAFAVMGAMIGLIGGMQQRPGAAKWTRWAVYGFALCMFSANLTMVHALVTHDFSVKYVAQVGSLKTPLIFTVVSLWSALEGSILFWGAIMGVYLLTFALVYRREHERYMTLALGTMLAVGAFFAFLIAGPATPWTLINPAPLDGPGPNPLLQNNILMVIHPPFLYAGYVGMVVPFGVAVAALLRGELGEAWMAPLRRWTVIAWAFLSCGITLGSWWAYDVLGWGGYWSWDPVENASFLPWLTATAFIHSTMVHERKRMLKAWTVSLALATFLLTMLGTFMTRSGIFNSVHSFTQSDIGPTFLVFIAIVLVVSIALLAIRGPVLAAEGQIRDVLSRETSILVNNLLFVALTFTVLLGTLYPLISEAIGHGRVSVGGPYFNKMAVPSGVAILFLMGVGPVLPWGQADRKAVVRQFVLPLAVGVVTVLACAAFGLRGFLPLLTFGLAGFVSTVTLRELFLPAAIRIRQHGENPFTAVIQSASKARRRFGGYVVHLGIVIIFVAIAASQNYVTHQQGTMRVGQTMTVGGYTLKFLGLTSGTEPRRTFNAARIEVTTPSGKVEELQPRLNYYERSNDPVGGPVQRTAPFEDLYLSLMAFSPLEPSATLNTWVFPMVSWIWWALPVLVLGSLIAAWPQRKRKVNVDPSANGAAETSASSARSNVQQGAA